MTTLITRKLQFNNAEQFKEEFAEPQPTISYVFIGNHVPYVDENTPPSLSDTVVTEKQAWDNMYAAKRVTGNDVELVIPKVIWTANTKYRQYDDTSSIPTLLSANTQQNLKPMYVITADRNVYKCLSNNSSANSTVKPTGDYTSSNGNIATSDGYLWKYMFNVKPSNKFLTDEWIPAPTSTDALDYGVNSQGVIDGELSTILVTQKGTNYRELSNIKVDSFTSGQSTFRLANTSNVLSWFSIPTLANLANMSISGTGLSTGTYISKIYLANGVIVLSSDAFSTGGGNSNTVSITTRVYVDGDGVGINVYSTFSNTNINASQNDANVANIYTVTIGTNYSRANVLIFGSGTGANARAILSPKFGHGYNPAKELNANNVMIAVRIGEIDSSEDGVISTSTTFRQFGLMRDPYKYGNTTPVTSANADAVISQTTNLQLVSGPAYTLNEYVYQGDSPNLASAYGFLNSVTDSGTTVRLTKVVGTFVTGNPLIGATSGVSRTVTSTSNPTFQPYSGDMLYIENDTAITRSDGQAENIKMIVSF
jgi:hypothetical protein